MYIESNLCSIIIYFIKKNNLLWNSVTKRNIQKNKQSFYSINIFFIYIFLDTKVKINLVFSSFLKPGEEENITQEIQQI